MYYSETKVILGGLAHVPILIFIVNFIQGKFEAIAVKEAAVRKEDVKSSEVKANAADVIKEEGRAGEMKASDIKDDTEWQ